MVIAVAILGATAGGASAAEANWDGTWSGDLGRQKPWPVTLVIAGGKVVSFAERGVPFDVRFSDVTANGVVFGDRRNYRVELNRSGADAATGQVRGRFGIGPTRLSRS